MWCSKNILVVQEQSSLFDRSENKRKIECVDLFGFLFFFNEREYNLKFEILIVKLCNWLSWNDLKIKKIKKNIKKCFTDKKKLRKTKREKN